MYPRKVPRRSFRRLSICTCCQRRKIASPDALFRRVRTECGRTRCDPTVSFYATVGIKHAHLNSHLSIAFEPHSVSHNRPKRLPNKRGWTCVQPLRRCRYIRLLALQKAGGNPRYRRDHPDPNEQCSHIAHDGSDAQIRRDLANCTRPVITDPERRRKQPQAH